MYQEPGFSVGPSACLPEFISPLSLPLQGGPICPQVQKRGLERLPCPRSFQSPHSLSPVVHSEMTQSRNQPSAGSLQLHGPFRDTALQVTQGNAAQQIQCTGPRTAPSPHSLGPGAMEKGRERQPPQAMPASWEMLPVGFLSGQLGCKHLSRSATLLFHKCMPRPSTFVKGTERSHLYSRGPEMGDCSEPGPSVFLPGHPLSWLSAGSQDAAWEEADESQETPGRACWGCFNPPERSHKIGEESRHGDPAAVDTPRGHWAAFLPPPPAVLSALPWLFLCQNNTSKPRWDLKV